MDSFVQEYINPNSPFITRIDPATGALRVDEKMPGRNYTAITNPITQKEPLAAFGKSLEYNGSNTIDVSKANIDSSSTNINITSVIGGAGNANTSTQPMGLSPELLNILNIPAFANLGTTQTAELIKSTAIAFTTPTRTMVKCKLETTIQDAEQVNRWMQELNQS